MSSTDKSPSAPPLVTVVMAVRNEVRHLDRSLGSVLAQDYPQDRLEIIVADGSSRDGTREKASSILEGRERARVLHNPGCTAASGLNLAIAIAGGDIIVRVDGHCEISPNYVRRCVDLLSSGLTEGIGGALVAVGETRLARGIALAMSSRFGVGDSFRAHRGGISKVDTIAFPAYRRETLDLAGPYDEEFVRNQDDEYNYRLRKMGARLVLDPSASARYYNRPTLTSLGKQFFRYGYWKVRVMQKHPAQMRVRQFVPPLFVASLGTTALSVPFLWWGAPLLALLSGAYLTANIAASARIASRKGVKHFPSLPPAFMVLHFSYGAGFLIGLWAFRNGNGNGEE